ncbi:hypothetical protein K9B35_07795 [Sphingomonas sp. R647]|uniref:hypothetical protein n=1 Tax=Sphingomonas sp. R647 TaxID=2875233 RepID=UPI001CD7FB18|nr:hypothetical protein [Sphingomonas sp. R647]MCA1197866.1 hypothetical protein [Sphingomonas sp. R647]
MALQISLGDGADISASLDLKELMDKLRHEGVHVEPVTASESGAKSAILIGLSIASVTLSTISTTIAVLNFWGNKNKKNYRIVLHSRGQVVPLADLSSGQLNHVADADESAEIVIEKI